MLTSPARAADRAGEAAPTTAAIPAAEAAAQGLQQPSPTAAAQSAGPAGNQLQEVVVTGSLIRQPNEVASSPIVVTTAAAIRQSGQVDIESALNQLPEFTPAGTSSTGGQGTGGHATVNLHGLGSNRNLVLLDGRRLPLADISGDVDINMLPTAIISSVETITGGASAVYGSDAMSGVVNFKTIQNLQGVKIDAQYGNSFLEDYRTADSSVAFGSQFGDGKGHVLVALGYTYNQGLSGARRSFFEYQTPSSYIGQDTFVPSANNLPNKAVLSGLFAGYGITKPVSNTANLGFNDDGTLFTQNGALNYKGPTSNGYAILAGNVRMPVAPQTLIENPLDRHNIFSKFDYRLAQSVVAYGQIMYADWDVTTSSGKSLTQFGTLTTIPVTNPFIPADLATLLASRPNPTAPFVWNGRYVGLPNKSWDEHYTVDQFLGGFRGALPFGDWTWDVYASWDSTRHLQSNNYAVLKSQVQNLLNAPDGGNSLCAGGFDPFGLANSSKISPACQQYMTTTAHSTETISQGQEQAVIQGALFRLPAGPVRLAFLADHRTNDYVYSPDSQLAEQNIEAVIASQPTRGSIAVTEGATQIEVPLLRDLPAVERLDLGGAYRFSHYDTSGAVSTYAGDIKWNPVESFLVRGGYQRAVRAPNVGELFSAASGSQIAFGTPPQSIGDPCDIRSTARTGANGAQVAALCQAQGMPASIVNSYVFPTTATAGLTQGNPKLTPERANTFNFGLVWTSSARSPVLRRLSASIDYYNIAIDNVISIVPGLTALSKCYNLDGSNPGYSPTNEFCQLLTRDPQTGQLLVINTPYLNLGGLKTDGIDVQLNWAADLDDVTGNHAKGVVALQSGLGYTRNYEVKTLPGQPWLDYAGTNTLNASYPRWKAVTSMSYSLAGVTAGLRWRYQDAMSDVSAVTTPKSPGVGVAPYNVYDFFAFYDLNGTWQFRGGINNMFNRGLPVVASSQTGTDTAVFDPVGRAYYVGVTLSLR
jgi:iron complex outermembrane recepter protein